MRNNLTYETCVAHLTVIHGGEDHLWWSHLKNVETAVKTAAAYAYGLQAR